MAGADEAPILWGLHPTWQPLGLREGAALQGCGEWSRVAAAKAPPPVPLATPPSPHPVPGGQDAHPLVSARRCSQTGLSTPVAPQPCPPPWLRARQWEPPGGRIYQSSLRPVLRGCPARGAPPGLCPDGLGRAVLCQASARCPAAATASRRPDSSPGPQGPGRGGAASQFPPLSLQE